MAITGNLSPEWIEHLYQLWQSSPASVPDDWRSFFRGFELGLGREVPAGAPACTPDEVRKQAAVQTLIDRHREVGHLLACTDPLTPCPVDHPLLSLGAFGLSPADLESVFFPRHFLSESAPLRDILDVMRTTYCRSLGVEFMHIQSPDERQWLIERMEPTRNRPSFTPDERLVIVRQLREATSFEEYLNRRFIGQTRFSLEGGEVLIPMLADVIAHGARLGIATIVMGMPHRGRLNVLANVIGCPLENIFAQFRDNLEHGVIGDGDVKYHIGCSRDCEPFPGNRVHVTLTANPSHLEAIDPVVEGKARALQDRAGDGRKGEILPLLVHGDAAFSGQGVVAETFNLSQLEGYGTGGTVHIVLNNQIGFTTLPKDARSSTYATDVAKSVMAPVFHVHGEAPEAAVHAVRLAVEYRQRFRRDAVVEIICYRRYGHNEGDEPYFTQPLMYRTIKDRPPVGEIYGAQLREEGVPGEVLAGFDRDYAALLDEAYNRHEVVEDVGFQGDWSGVKREYTPFAGETGVAQGELVSLSAELASLPPGFTPHPKVVAVLSRRKEAVESGEGIDWAGAETLAFATLLREGTPIRLSGQDVRRGTFSQRHCFLFDTVTGTTFAPLETVAAEGGRFIAFDSMLSENAVLGFEYGYSLATPGGLTLWEAQYGDFANGAQVVIDQFVASSETKWQRVSGLVLLLPHGYEGQGSEHSSARIERFLQLCADTNLQVAFPTTPAQYFHLLRRQVLQPFRKPLIVFTPKSLLRHPRCVSSLADLTTGRFREMLASPPAESARLVFFCTGKIYFELLERCEREGRGDVAIIRIEQLYPLRTELLREALAGFPQAERFRWVQEEPENMGAWSFLRPRLTALLGSEPEYVGRREDASPAVGSHRLHKIDQERVIAAAFEP
jgi:2-oxoglutarate dehydrogenase E1 component